MRDQEWALVRAEYETSTLSLRAIARKYGLSESTALKRAAREKWNQGAQLIAEARDQLAIKTTEALSVATDKAADIAAQQLIDELQPWIAQQKTEHIKRAVKRSRRAQDRLDKVAKGFRVQGKDGEIVLLRPGPKEESFLAQSEDKYDNIIRRNLGMNDISASGGTLSLNILMGQAVINQPSSNSAGDV